MPHGKIKSRLTASTRLSAYASWITDTQTSNDKGHILQTGELGKTDRQKDTQTVRQMDATKYKSLASWLIWHYKASLLWAVSRGCMLLGLVQHVTNLCIVIMRRSAGKG